MPEDDATRVEPPRGNASDLLHPAERSRPVDLVVERDDPTVGS
jgi:hypothetical protein